MAPGSEHRSPIRTDYIAKNSIRGFVNNFLMGLSDSGHPQARRQNYAPQYHNVVGSSRFSPIYWGHKAPAKGVVENCRARQSKEASAAIDLFGGHSPSPPLPPTPWSRRPQAVGSSPSITVAKPPAPQPDRSANGRLSGRDDILRLENAYGRDRGR